MHGEQCFCSELSGPGKVLGFGGCRAPNFSCLRILSLVLSPQKKLLTSPVLWAGDSSRVSCLLDTGQVVGGVGGGCGLKSAAQQAGTDGPGLSPASLRLRQVGW